MYQNLIQKSIIEIFINKKSPPIKAGIALIIIIENRYTYYSLKLQILVFISKFDMCNAFALFEILCINVS